MEAALAARYPEIRTYSGAAIGDPSVTMRCDLTPQGFHATVIQAEHEVVTIHPDLRTDPRASRYVSSFGTSTGDSDEPLVCDFRDPDRPQGGVPFDQQELDLSALSYQSGDTLRVYRIAIAATWEYCNTFGGGTTAGTVALWLGDVGEFIGFGADLSPACARELAAALYAHADAAETMPKGGDE